MEVTHVDRSKYLKLSLVIVAAFGLGAGTMWGMVRKPDGTAHKPPLSPVVMANPVDDGGAAPDKPTSVRPPKARPGTDPIATPRPPKPPKPPTVADPKPRPPRGVSGKPVKPDKPKPPVG
jgi:hypothetical protein